MIDKSEVMHNIKVGSDTDLFISRINTDKKSEKFTKIKSHEAGFDYPYLTRTTGNSLKPTTEYIQSNELRHGGAESAPRPGNTSVEGSIDVEVSPDTFDDNFSALFNNEWKRWESDSNSDSNLDDIPCGTGQFLTRACKLKDPSDPTEGYDEDSYNPDEEFKPRHLLKNAAQNDGILEVPEGAVVNEITFGKKSIEYLITKKYGGFEGEDMYHIFKRLAVGTLDLNAEIGSIVTGSFGFMGDSSSDILGTQDAKNYLGGSSDDDFEDDTMSGNKYIDELPEKATETDQFTSREGDLWINGKNITFGQSLSFNVDKNLEKKYALFVKNPIAKSSLRKAITANLSTYLVPDSQTLYNLANNNKTFEVLFAFEDKGYKNDSFKAEDKPQNIYLFQIFNAKAEDRDLSASGESDYNMTIPLRSFGERLVRVFKIAVPKLTKSKPVVVNSAKAALFTPNIVLGMGDIVEYNASTAPNGLKVKVQVGSGTPTDLTLDIGYETGVLTTSKPANWDTNYTDYYKKEGNKFVRLQAQTTPPDWAAGTYYEAGVVDAGGTANPDANVILDLLDAGEDGTYGKVTIIPDSGATPGDAVVVTANLGGQDCSCHFTA